MDFPFFKWTIHIGRARRVAAPIEPSAPWPHETAEPLPAAAVEEAAPRFETLSAPAEPTVTVAAAEPEPQFQPYLSIGTGCGTVRSSYSGSSKPPPRRRMQMQKRRRSARIKAATPCGCSACWRPDPPAWTAWRAWPRSPGISSARMFAGRLGNAVITAGSLATSSAGRLPNPEACGARMTV